MEDAKKGKTAPQNRSPAHRRHAVFPWGQGPQRPARPGTDHASDPGPDATDSPGAEMRLGSRSREKRSPGEWGVGGGNALWEGTPLLPSTGVL